MTTDRVIDMAWSDIQVGMFIRWATPRFIKYGRIVTRGGNSMSVQFIEDASPRAIPEAKWYFVEGKRDPQAEEHLVVIDYASWYNGPPVVPFIPEVQDAHEVYISAAQAAEFLSMQEKQVRRYIRQGKIPAFKRDGWWVINRERLREAAAKNGWI